MKETLASLWCFRTFGQDFTSTIEKFIGKFSAVFILTHCTPLKKSFSSFSFVLAIVMFAGLATAQKRRPAEARAPIVEDHAAEAAAWLAHFINPMGESNYDSLQQAGYEQFIRMDNRPAMQVASSAAWVEVAKSQGGRVSGRPSGIDFDPNGAIYLATTNGGLWKSTTNGQNWSSLSGTWKTLNVGGVAVDPENPNTIYAGTGIYLSTVAGAGNISGAGVYQSTDGGLNWTLLDSLSGLVTTQIEVNPANSSYVYRATTSGIRLSTNGGATWTSSAGATFGGYTSMVIDPQNPAILYAAGGSQIKKSTDSGMTWTALPGGYPTGPLMILGMSGVSSDSIYVSTGYSGVIGLSTNAGATWSRPWNSLNYLGQQSGYANAMAVNPSNPSVLVAGGLNIYSLTRGGTHLADSTNWQADPGASNYTHADIHVLKYDPYNNELFALTDGGIFYSTTNGASWKQDMNADLGTMLFVGGDMAVDQSAKPSFFAAGAQDNGLNAFTPGQDAYYNSIRGGDGGTMFVSPSDGQTIYGTYVFATLYSSSDRGANGDMQNSPNLLDGTPVQSEGTPFYMEYDVADDNPYVVAVCGNRNLFLSQDTRIYANFPQMTNLGPGTGTTISGDATTVDIATNADYDLYLGTTANALYYSQDQGVTWTRSANPISFGGSPTSIATDPNDPTHVFMTVGGTTSKHFWVSTDGGQDWTAPATDLPNLNYRRVAYDGKIIYVGTDYGVLRSGDGGKTWYPVADGLPMTMVTALHVRGNYLLASTYGRGMFYVDLTQVPPVPTSSGVVANAGVTNSGIAISAIYPSVVASGTARSTIDYTLANSDQATIAVYDILGRQERMLVNQFDTKGDHQVSADLSGITPGQHYIVLTSGGVSVTKPITIE